METGFRMKSTLVVARHNENTSWTKDCKADNIVIIQKDVDVPNKGREPASYLYYIIQNYDNLEGVYFFSQGFPFDHCPNFIEELNNTEGDFRWFSNRNNLTCKMNGHPQDNIDITRFLKECDIEYNKDTITFNGCCLFMLSTELIKKHPKQYYEKILNAVYNVPKGEYCFERCVEIIWYMK